MRTYIRPLSSAFVLALSLPVFAQERTVTVAPSDDNVAEANVFMNAKLIAIERDRDQIEIRDNNGKKKTLALAEDATVPQERLKAGTDVLLSVRERGSRGDEVVAVRPSEPTTRTRARSNATSSKTNVTPLYLPGSATTPSGLEREAAGQASYISGGAAVPSGSSGGEGPQYLGGGVVDPRLVGPSGVTTTDGSNPATAGTAGPTSGTRTQTGPINGTTTQSTVPPGGTTIVGSDTNAQVRTRPITGTTLQTGATAAAPNTFGNPANTSTLTSPVTGTTTQSAPLARNPAITGQAINGTTFTNSDLSARSTTGSTAVAQASGVVPLGSAAGPASTVGSSPTVGSPGSGAGTGDGGGLGADAAPLPVGRAVQAYEAAVARLSVKADEVDAAFSRYRDSCIGPEATTANAGTRSWMGIWNGSTVPAESRDQCEPLLAAALRVGEQVKRGMRNADDMARRSGVLPGITRQIRTAYNMDWAGWDN